MRLLTTTMIAAAWLVALANPVHAQGAQGGAAGPTVVELFTSQSCYSCPPAEAFLATLADRPDVLTLEFHVDYWNSLVYGRHGRWEDPFSSPAATQRQRDYNIAIRGRGDVYTPQIVVDGRLEAVGSAGGTILSLIEKSVAEKRARVGVRIVSAPSGGFTVALAGDAPAAAGIWLAIFVDRATTRVTAGENHDKALSSRHIVVAWRKVGEWRGGKATLALDAVKLEPGQGCAVLVQPDGQGPILGAAACPVPPLG